MADAASRAWTEPYKTRWTNFSSSWTQTPVPKECRKLYTKFSSSFKPSRWPRLQSQNTTAPGASGPSGASGLIFRNVYPKIPADTRTSWLYSLPTAGNLDGTTRKSVIRPTPSSPRSLISRGIIGECLGTELAFSEDTNLQLLECDDQTHQLTQSTLSQSISSRGCMSSSISSYPSTESFGGASVLGFFFLLRKSEYLAEGSTVQTYAIRRSDIRFMGSDDEEGKNLLDVIAVVVQFRGSKSDQFGEGTSRRLERSGSRWCCPVLAAWFLVSHHKTLGVAPESHLCRIDSSTNLQVRDVVKVIKMAAAKAGYHPKRFGSNSLRSGGATALFNAGFDSLAVKLFGRWKSDAVERYTRIGRRLTEKMAQQMITKSTSARSLGASATPHPGSGQHERKHYYCAYQGTPPESIATTNEMEIFLLRRKIA
ncbi:hypothetical protein F441_22579, partial [Phytophthora nicotianae CJ01A1]